MNLPDPERLPTTHKARRAARRAEQFGQARQVLAVGAAVLLVAVILGGLVLVNGQGASTARGVGKTGTPAPTARNSPAVIPSATAFVAAARSAVPALPSPAGSLTPTQTTAPTGFLAGSITAQPNATRTNTPGTAARPTAVPKPARTATATATRAPSASPLPNVAPGVYVTGMRIDPAQVMDGQNPSFYVTFLNTVGTPVTYTWFIKVFEPDKRQSFGEVAKVGNAIAPGSSTLVSASNWKAPGEQPCRPFVARVYYYMAQDNAVVEFSKPDGNPYVVNFTVCQ